MTTDRVGKLLERVAAEAKGNYDYSLRPEAIIEVLEERLGPLLRAGQAMSEHRGGCCPELDRLQDDWDNAVAAVATLEGRDGK